MRANYHTHSLFCDGKASAAAMARAARDAGYDILGFSSHAPFPHGGDWVMKAESLSAYAEEIRRLGGVWAEGGQEAASSAPMEILLGLEVDWFPGERGPADGAFDSIDPDYLIGSVHFVEPVHGQLFTVDCSAEHFAAAFSALRDAGGRLEDICRDYYARQAAMIDAGGFDILGHLDLVKKNNFVSSFVDLDGAAYLDAAFEAASHLVGRDIVVEVNLGGMARGICPEPYPSLPILRELRRLGVRITFCADAHAPAHLGSHLEAARALAKAAGYDSVAVLSHGFWTDYPVEET